MFRKVFKYDFRAMGKFLLLAPAIWALNLAAAGLIRLLDLPFMTEYIFPELIAGATVFFCLAAVGFFPVGILILCLRRYYKNFFSDEGYLTFTLPVSRETLLWSKTVSTGAVCVLAGVAELIAGLIFILTIPDGTSFFVELFRDLISAFSEPGFTLFVVLLFFNFVVTLADEIATLHFSITLGHMVAKKHKILAAFGLWYAINFGKRLVTQGFSLLFLFAIFSAPDGALTALNGVMILFLLLRSGSFTGFYFGNRHLLKTRLALG
ncbi:MAG: hypothetical protein J6Z79_04200 [Clostridia bacterium]|nr:hypothetical protein [Clostridia bacterium]